MLEVKKVHQLDTRDLIMLQSSVLQGNKSCLTKTVLTMLFISLAIRLLCLSFENREKNRAGGVISLLLDSSRRPHGNSHDGQISPGGLVLNSLMQTPKIIQHIGSRHLQAGLHGPLSGDCEEIPLPFWKKASHCCYLAHWRFTSFRTYMVQEV